MAREIVVIIRPWVALLRDGEPEWDPQNEARGESYQRKPQECGLGIVMVGHFFMGVGFPVDKEKGLNAISDLVEIFQNKIPRPILYFTAKQRLRRPAC